MERVRPAKTLAVSWPSGEPNHRTAPTTGARGRPGANGVRGGRGAGGVLAPLAATATDGHPGAAEALGAAKARGRFFGVRFFCAGESKGSEI